MIKKLKIEITWFIDRKLILFEYKIYIKSADIFKNIHLSKTLSTIIVSWKKLKFA